MNIFVSRFVKFSLSFLLISLISFGCTAATPDFNEKLNKAYEQLYLARFGLEYPPREDILRICLEKKLQDCLSVYNPVQEGKQTLRAAIAKDKAAVFTHLTNTIAQDCTKTDTKTEQQAIFRCYGAVIAWYFFTDPVYNQKLQDILAHAPSTIAKIILGTRYEWNYNRPQVDKLITLIKALPTDTLTDAEKQSIIRFFKESQQPYEKFGVML